MSSCHALLQGSANQLAAEKAAEQKQHEQQTAQLEAQIQALDSLRYDLEQAKANLTAKLELSSATNTALEIQILEVRHPVGSALLTFFLIFYSLGCGASCDSSNILAYRHRCSCCATKQRS